MRWCWANMALLAVLVAAGCAATTVTRNPGPHDRGFRFYRPKPFVLINQLYAKDGAVVKGYYTLSVEYLPDFSEQCSLHVRTGFGINKTDAEFAHGWNLTKLTVDIDSQTADNVGAMAELLKSVKGFLPERAGIAQDDVVVRGANVPLGYYEAVLGRDSHGKKRLYGWRYVGLLPYQHCPVDVGGKDFHPCEGQELYGLVVEDHIMMFRLLSDARERKAELVPAPAK